MKKMKVLHINSSKFWGGGELYVLMLCKKLSELGIDVTLACRPNTPVDNAFKNEGLCVLNLPLRNSVDFISVIKLAIFCLRHKVNIINTHLPRDYWFAYTAKMIFKKMKVVFTYHLVYPLKNNKRYKAMFDKTDKVIAVSEAVKNAIVNSNVVLESKITVIHNGIDTKKFETAIPGSFRTELGFKQNDIVIGIVGRIVKEKGQDLFIKSIPEILKSYPKVQFVIVGDDGQEDKYNIAELKNLAEDLGISDKVKFTGFRSDISSVMKDLDIFVLASEHEPFGLVIVEAMAAGVPVVVTNAGGAKDIIINNASGIMIEPGSPEEIAQSVIKLLDDKNLYNSLSSAGIIRAREFFDISTMTNNILNTYKSLN